MRAFRSCRLKALTQLPETEGYARISQGGASMSQATVGKWGDNLAIRVPFEVARASGLSDGERVEIEALDGDILIRRPAARAIRRRQAEAAAAEIVDESKKYSLGVTSIRDLLEEGRRS
jgi:antitoxin MazE